MDTDRRLTRAQLYEMVWSEPMSLLAKRFGISDVTLRRICERFDIVRPSPGYWSKLAYGKDVEKVPLSVETREPTVIVNIGSMRDRVSRGSRIGIALCTLLLTSEV